MASKSNSKHVVQVVEQEEKHETEKKAPSLELSQIKGIGDATEAKLNSLGVMNILDLAVVTPRELIDKAGIGPEKAQEYCVAARVLLMGSGFLEKEFVPATEIMERRRSLARITTGSKALDAVLGGGVETQAITELVGEFGTGKTQLCHNLCVNVQLPREHGGLEGTAIYIDTESTFRAERVHQIAERRGLDPQKILSNIIVCTVYNSSHLEVVMRELGKYVEKFKARLVIVDSIISHFRAEFIGRQTLSERQQRLNELLHRFLRAARVYNFAGVLTNQVQANPDNFYADPTKPAGGHILAHASTYRIFLRKSKPPNRIARFIDTPHLYGESETVFRITEKGIEDPEDSKE